MKKLNLGNINAGLSTIKELANENAGIARDELIDVSLIDFANKNTYAANDTDDSIRDLADQIETVGLLNPLGVIQSGNRYKLFSGERRYRAITQYLHWDKIPCRIFEGVSAGRAQLMLHIANGGRDYTAEQKLTLYEEYRELLNELKASGEFKGGIQKGVAELMHVSDRQVRTYRTMSEQLTEPEKVDLAAGTLKFGEASRQSNAADSSKRHKKRKYFRFFEQDRKHKELSKPGNARRPAPQSHHEWVYLELRRSVRLLC